MENIMKKYIQKAIEAFYKLIDGKEEGEPDTRYRSWEWCYDAFKKGKKKYDGAGKEEKAEIVDYLSLHLGFYLASWGMYRGSSYLLKRDYKAHKKVVEMILEADKSLWGFNPKSESIDNAREKLFGEDGLYMKIKNGYNNYENSNEDDASDTLVTKILLGTLGCVPAFDRFLKKGIKWLKDKYSSAEKEKLTATIENNKNPGSTFVALSKFAIKFKEELKLKNVETVEYPVMKCVDMFFWQVGYELDLLKGLEDNKNSNDKKKKLVFAASKCEICEEYDTVEEVIETIKSRWDL